MIEMNHTTIYESDYDPVIQEVLQTLPLGKLRELSEYSCTTLNSGYLTANEDTADRDDFIEEISDMHDKEDW